MVRGLELRATKVTLSQPCEMRQVDFFSHAILGLALVRLICWRTLRVFSFSLICGCSFLFSFFFYFFGNFFASFVGAGIKAEIEFQFPFPVGFLCQGWAAEIFQFSFFKLNLVL